MVPARRSPPGFKNKLRSIAGKACPNGKCKLPGGTCSFRGDTQVLTSVGYQRIDAIRAGDLVWSRDDRTGRMAFLRVLRQYSNPYEDTVYITIRDVRTGTRQTIVSNRIHPFFVKRTEPAAPLLLIANAGDSGNSEGHVYRGRIEGGRWVDADHLQRGDRLLQADEEWSEVVSVTIVPEPLKAYNISVATSETFYVRAGDATAEADSVWVHNCPPPYFDIKRLPQERQDAVADTLSHINKGTRPAGPTGRRWGVEFENRPRAGESRPDLPAKDAKGNLITYTEYRVSPRPGQSGGGTDRIVIGSDGNRYYTGSHYGDMGGKPFVRIN